MSSFTPFIPCIIGNRFTALDQQNAQNCSLDIYIVIYYITCTNIKRGIVI